MDRLDFQFTENKPTPLIIFIFIFLESPVVYEEISSVVNVPERI